MITGSITAAIIKITDDLKKGVLEIDKDVEINGVESGSTMTESQRESIEFTVEMVDASGNAVLNADGSKRFSEKLTYADFTNGKYRFEGLDVGTYKVTETNYDLAALNYSDTTTQNGNEVDAVIDTAQKTFLFEVKAGDSPATEHVVRYTNRYAPADASLIVKKTDGTGNVNLYGAEFQIEYKASENGDYAPLSGNSIVDENGRFVIPYSAKDSGVTLRGLQNGFYRITETRSPNGYRISGTGVFEFEISNGQIVNNQSNPASVTYTAASDSMPAAYTVKNGIEHGYTITKIEKGNVSAQLKGAEFTVYECPKTQGTAAEPIKTYITDDEGAFEILLSDSEKYKESTTSEGHLYCVKETKAPAGYALNNTAYFFYWGSTVDTANFYEPGKNVHPTSAVVLGATQQYALIEDNPETTTISFYKKWQTNDGQNLSADEIPVEEVEFIIWQIPTVDGVLKENEKTQYPNATTSYKLSAKSDWRYDVKNLPKGKSDGGHVITYTYRAEEKTEVEGFVSSVNANGNEIINKPEPMEITVQKVWEGVPQGTSVKVRLYRDLHEDETPESLFDYQKYTAPDGSTWRYVAEGIVQASEGWKYTFGNLSKNETYHVVEVLEGNLVNTTDVFYSKSAITESGTVTILNMPKDSKSLAVLKVWEGDTAEERPESIDIDLYRAKGSVSGKRITIQTIKPDNNVYSTDVIVIDDSENSVTFSMASWDGDTSTIDVSVNGTAGETSIEPVEKNSVYTKVITVGGLKNNDVIRVSRSGEWNPAITLITQNSGTVTLDPTTEENYGTKMLTPDQGWYASWSDLPTAVEGDDSREWYYYVKESVPGYITTIDNNDGIQSGLITVTNTRSDEPVTTSLTVAKSWVNEDGSTDWPEDVSVTFTLMKEKNGTAIGLSGDEQAAVKSANTANEIVRTFSAEEPIPTDNDVWKDLPLLANGYTYTAVETKIQKGEEDLTEEYTSTSEQAAYKDAEGKYYTQAEYDAMEDGETKNALTAVSGVMRITNRKEQTVTVSAKKTWENTPGKLQATAVQFTLYQEVPKTKYDGAGDSADKFTLDEGGDARYYLAVKKDGLVNPQVVKATVTTDETTTPPTVTYTWPDEATWDRLPKYTEGTEPEAVYYVKETGVYYGDRSKLDDADEPATFADPHELDGFSVSGEGTVSFDAEGTGSVTIINDVEPIDIKVKKAWADFSGSGYFWKIKFQLEYKETPIGELKGNADYAETLEAIDDAFITFSKADNDETSGEGLARRTFKDLPSFRVDEYGNVFAIEYSALESEYWVYEGTDENGTLIAHFDELNNTNPLGDKYSGDFDTDPTAENDYTMHVTNTKDTTIVGAKIDLGIEKTGWTEQGTNRNLLQEDDTWAEFTLRRFMHYEYRDYTDIAEDDDHKVTITVRDANEAVLNTLETYQGMEVSVMATFKTGADGNGYLEFGRSDDPNSSIVVYHNTSASKKELVRSATFIAAGDMTITLKDNSQLNLLADGAQGIQATDTITPTADTVDSSYTGPVFRLNKQNGWKLTAENDGRLKDLPLISIKREGKQETITVYSYYFEETRSNPLGYNASYQDEAGNPVGRDNRLYVSSEVKAENHSTEAMHIIKKWYRLEDAIQPPVVVKVKENGRDLKSTGFSDNGVEVDYNEKYGGYVLNTENDWNVNFYGLDSGVRRDFIELGYLASPDAETVTPLPSDAFDAKHYWFGENDDDHPNESVYNELMPKITTNGGQNINKTTGTMFIYNVPHYIGYQPEFKKYWYGFNGHMQNEADYGSDGSVMFTVQIQQKARWMEDGEGHQAGDEITSVGEDGWVDYLQPFNVWYDHNTAAQQNYEDITNLADSWLVNVKEYNVAKWGFVDVGGGRYELVEYDYRFKELSVTDESGRTWTKDSAGIDDGSGKHRYDIFNFETGPLGLKKQWQLKGEVPAKVYFQVTQCDGGRMPDVAKFVYEDIQKARAKGETELEKALQYWNIRQDNVVEDEGQYYFVITSEDLASVQENENSGIIDWYIEIHNLDIFINGLEKNYGEATYEVHEAGYATKAAPNTFIPLGDAQDPWTCYYYRSVRGQSDQMVGATERGIQIDNTVDPGTGAKKPVSYYKVVNTDVSTTEFTVEKTWPDEMQPDENTKIVLELQQRVADVDENGNIKLNDGTVLTDLTKLQENLDKVVWKSGWTAAEYAHPNVLTLPTTEGEWSLTWKDLPLEKVVGVNKGSGSSNNMALLAPIFYRVVETSAPSWTDPNITVRVGDSEQKIAIGADSTYIGQGGVYSMDTGDYVADRLEQTIQNDAKSFELKVTKDWNDVNDTENETMSTWPAGYSVDYAVVRHAFEQKSHLINGEIIYSTGTEALENAFLDASGAWKVIDPETEKTVSNTGDTYATSVKVGGTDTPFKTGTLDSEHQSADKTTLPKLGELAKGGFITVMTTAEGSEAPKEVTKAVVYTYEVIETGGTRPANSSYSFPAVSAQVETEEQVEDPQNPSETVTQEIEHPEARLVNRLTDLEVEKKWYTKSKDGTVTEISAPAGNAGFKMTGKLYRSLTPADDDTFTVTFKNKWKLTSGAVVGGTEPGQTAPENGAIEVTITSDTTQRKYHLVLDDFENTIRLPKGSTYTVSYGSNDNVEKVTDDLNGAKISEDQATVNTEIEMAMTGPRIVIIVKGTPGNGFGITEISERTWDGNNANSAEKQPKDTSSIPNPITEAGTYVIPLEEEEIGKVFGIKLNNSGNVVAYGDAFFRTWSDYWLINTNSGAATIVLDFDPHYAEIAIAINADGGYRCSDFGWNASYGDSGKTRGTEATKQIVQGATQRYTIESTVNASSILVAGDISSYSVGQWTPHTGWPLYNSTYYSITVTITAAENAENITLTITDPVIAGTNTAAKPMAAPRMMMAAPPMAVRSLAAPLRAASSSSDFTLVNDISMLPEDAEQLEEFELNGSETEPWHKTWTDLPAVDENGNPIYYYIVEDEVELPDSYRNAQSVTVEYVYDYVKKTETVHNDVTGEDEEIEVIVALKKAVIGNTISTKVEYGSLVVTKELLGLPQSAMSTASFGINVTGPGPSESRTGTLSAENGWTCTFDNLAVGSYTVQETSTGVEGYVWVEANSTAEVTASVRADETTPVTLTNVYTKDVSFSKIWVNEDGKWPTDEEITVEITRSYGDGSGTVDDAFKLVYKAGNGVAVLNEGQSIIPVGYHPPESISASTDPTTKRSPYTFTITGLPEYEKLGEITRQYTYTATETSVSEKYVQSADGNDITNTEVLDIEATKTWKNSDGTDITETITNATVTFTLQSSINGEDWTDVLNTWNEEQETGNKNPVTLSVDDTANAEAWKASWNDLPAYTSDGTPIQYRVIESEAEVHTKESEEDVTPKNEEGKPKPEIVTVTDGLGTANLINTLPSRVIKATKVWEDNNNELSQRPDKIIFRLNRQSEGSELVQLVGEKEILKDATGDDLTVIWEELPKYDEHGKLITYTVEETMVDHYSTTVSGDMDSGYTIRNKLISTSIPGKKTMQNRALTEEDVYSFVISAEHGTPLPEELTVQNSTETGEFSFGPICYTRADLELDPEATSGTKEKTFTYTITEDSTEPKSGVVYDSTVYTVGIKVTYNYETGEISVAKPVITVGEEEKTEIEFVNTDLTKIVVKKEWQTADEKKMENPPSGAAVVFGLFKQEKDGTLTEVMKDEKQVTVTLTGVKTPEDSIPVDGSDPDGYASGEWEATFMNLPRYEKNDGDQTVEGQTAEDQTAEIVYVVKEIETQKCDGYKNMTPDGVEDQGTIINRETKFSFTKEWYLNDQYLVWPEGETITVTLNAYTTDPTKKALEDVGYTLSPEEGKHEGWTVTVNENHTYTFTITGLQAATQDGKELTYYVVETPSDGYTVDYRTKADLPNVKASNAKDEEIIRNTQNSSYELPQTGGIGTTLFTALGGLMTVAAGAVLTLRRTASRRRGEKQAS